MPAGIDAGTANAQVRVNTGALHGDLLTAGTFFKTFAGGAVASLGAIGIAVVALTKTIQGMKAAVSTFAEFEQSMANVASVAKASTSEMEALNAAAAEAGRTTRFTASQAADALYYLASAGFDATQSISALDGVLFLAGATGSDLASTSESVASAISQYSLEASDATRVANVFTAAITNSQATMDKLSTSLSYVGPVASAFGASIEETVGLLQILYNNGFAASQAGTALRSALADLSNAASPAIAKLNTLGLTFEDVNPATHSLAEVIGTLSDAGLEGADIMAIFGDRAGPAMIKLIQAGREEIEAYTEAVTGTNAAAEAYAIQNDTLAGAQDRFKSATESLAIAIGEQLAPFLRQLLELGIQVVNWLTEAMPTISNIFKLITTLTPLGTIMALNKAMGDANTVTSQYAEDLDDVGKAIQNVNDIVEANKGIHNQRVELDGLVSEYETLTSQTTLNADEQERLRVVIDELAKRVPDAATAFDDFGNAIEINTGIARQASLDLLELEKANNEAALATLNAERQIAEERARALEYTRESTRDLYEESQARLNNISNDMVQLRAIEAQYFAEREAAGDDFVALQAAQAEAARNLYSAGFIDEATQNKIIEGQIGVVQALNAYVVPLKEEYQDLTESVDEQFQEWQAVEGQYRRANELLLEIKKTELEIEAIDRAIGVINTQNNDDQQDGIQETDQVQEEATNNELERMKDLNFKRRDFNQRRLDDLTKVLGGVVDEEKKTTQEIFEAWNDKNEELIDSVSGTYETMADLASDFFDSLTELYELDTEKRLASLEQQTNAQLTALDAQKNAELAAAGLLEDTEIERLKKELAEAKKTGDKENIEKAKDALTAAEIEQKYADEENRILAENDKKAAQIEYEGELRGWKLRLAEAVYTAPMMAMNAYNSAAAIPYVGWILAPAAAAAALALGLLNVRNIKKSKPERPAMAGGGIVLAGKQGGTEVTAAENGYNELMFNAGPSGRPFLQEFAGVVAEEVIKRGFPIHIVNQIDGEVIAENSAKYYRNNIVRLEP